MSQPVSRRAFWMLMAAFALSIGLGAKLALDKRTMASSYQRAQTELAQLQQERAQLSQELADAHQTIDTQAGDLSVLEQELARIQARLAEAGRELAALRMEQAQMKTSTQTLNDQLAAVTAEREALQARLSSLKELRLAVRDVKARLRRERWEAWLAGIKARRAEDQRELAKGNRGFVVRNGASTLGTPTRLQVRVLEPEVVGP